MVQAASNTDHYTLPSTHRPHTDRPHTPPQDRGHTTQRDALSHGIGTDTPTIEELTTDHKNTLTQGTETSHRHTLNADSYALPSTD